MGKKRLFVFAIILLAVAGLLSSVGIVNPKQIVNQKEQLITSGDIKIAIVNEDSGTEYNGEHLDMGNVLVRSFSASESYDMETVSRTTAERGLDNNYYQLMIVLPSTFSKDSLELESSSPKQAIFQYKIKSNKQVLLKQAEQAVLDFKTSLNRDIIHIYFTSIVGNLQEAQNHVAGIVESENDSLLYYQNSLSSPLKNHSDKFNGISNDSQSALTVFDLFNEQIHNTNQAFTDIASVDKDYGPQVDEVNKAQDEWKSSIEEKEDSIRKYDEDFSKLTVDDPLEQISEIKEQQLNSMLANPSWRTLVSNTVALKEKILQLNTDINEKNTKVATYLDGEYKDKIRNAVRESLDSNKIDTSGTLAYFVKDLKNDIDKYLLKEANKLPVVSDSQITFFKFGFGVYPMRKINSFLRAFAGIDTSNGKVNIRSAGYEGIKEYMRSKQIEDQITFDNVTGDISSVVISAPENYYFSNVQGNEQTEKKNEITLNPPFESSINYILKMREDISSENFGVFENPTVDVQVQSTLNTGENYNPASIEETNMQIDALRNLQSNDASTLDEFKALSIPKVEISTDGTTQSYTLTYHFSKSYSLGEGYENLSKDISDVATYNEMYNSFADKIKFFYGLDIKNNEYANKAEIIPTNDSYYSKLSLNGLSEILVDIVSGALIDDVKNSLKLETMENEVSTLQEDINKLNEQVNQFDSIVESTNSETARIIEETQKVKQTLLDKPEWIENEVRDNTDMVTVAMDINSDLIKLMNASATLMRNTESNQSTSESILSSFKELDQKVKNLESEGTALAQQVTDLENVLSKEYSTNKAFLDNFTNVLSNTKTGNSKNETVYQYLSNPINSQNLNTTLTSNQQQKSDFRSGLVIVLISYMASMIVGYFMQSVNVEKLRKKRVISRVSVRNAILPISILLLFGFLIGGVSGLVLGLKLKVDYLSILLLIGLMSYISIGFVLLNNLLFKHLKTLGMMFSVCFLLLFIITNSQFFDVAYEKMSQTISYFTPLTYGEQIITQWINSSTTTVIPVLVLSVMLLISLVCNLFTYRRAKI